MSGRPNQMLSTVLRVLPGPSPVRGMWAGSKLLALGLVASAAVVSPGRGTVIALVAVVLAALLGARVPLSVVPRPPIWLWVVLLIGAGASVVGGGLDLYVRTTLITVALIALGLVVTWTTPAEELAPALAALLRPLGRVGLPTSTWASTIALSVRALPLIGEDLQTILAVRRLRRPTDRPAISLPRRMRSLTSDGVDLAIAAVAVAARRGRDVGIAVAARGGVAAVRPQTPHLGSADLLCFVVTLTEVTAALVVR